MGRLKSKKIEFTDSEVFGIVYDYMIKDLQLVQIHNAYRDRCSMQYFSQMVTRALDKPKFMNKLLKCMLSPDKYDEITGNQRMLGAKKISYWSSENEILFEPVGFEDLSVDEKVIYYKNARK